MGKRAGGKPRLPGITIRYEDRELLVVEKPAGLLTIATEKKEERTAYYLLTDYVRKGSAHSKHRIFIVHRLDRETSGLLVFAKTEAAKRWLQAHWPETEKTYLAVVHGRPEKKTDTITSYLAENQAYTVYATADPARGKLAHTAYEVLKEMKGFSVLTIRLLTGRKHQIRVHLAGIGNPVVGDRKYGRGPGDGRRLMLHAYALSFPHPRHGRRLAFTTAVPDSFTRLVGPVPRLPPSTASDTPVGMGNATGEGDEE